MAKCYPIYLNLENQKCLVVGGGRVAERKVMSLLKCGARIRLVSQKITARLSKMIDKGLIDYRQGEYHPSDLAGVFLVVGATSSYEINRQLARDCQERNLLVNIVNNPECGNFYVPAVLSRGSFQVAISTDGKSPLLAKKVKEELEKIYGPEYAELTDFLGEVRKKIISENKGKDLLTRLVDDEVLYLMHRGLCNKAKERIIRNAYCRCGGKSSNSTSRDT